MYLKMREELLVGRNGRVRGRRGKGELEMEMEMGDLKKKKDVVW